jgi:Na+-driven multidrug efflux pump
MNIVSYFMNAAHGFNQALCTQIGKQIGMKDIESAKQYKSMGYAITSILFFVLSTQLYFNLSFYVSIFTNSTDVASIASRNNVLGNVSLPFILACSYFPDAMKNSQVGIIKALGLQTKAISIIFIGNWICCLSLMYLTMFKLHLGLHGIWISKLISDTAIFICNEIMIR